MTDFDLIAQPNKEIMARLERFNKATKETEEIQGSVLTFNLNIDSTSDIRRTVALTMCFDPATSAYFSNRLKSAWFNQIIIMYFGIKDQETKMYRWFPIGRFLLTNDNYYYSETSQQLTLSVADLMASITEERGNQVGSETIIEAGANLQDTMEQTANRFFPWLQQCITWNGVNNGGNTWSDYSATAWSGIKYGGDNKAICDFGGNVVPYDLEFNETTYPYEIIKKMVELYPCYEQFISVDGVYTVQEVPTGMDDAVVLTADQMSQLVIDENGSATPKDIKNTTELWGRELDADRTATSCDGTTTSGTYALFFDDTFGALEDGFLFSFTPDVASILGQKIKIQDTAEHTIGKMGSDGVFTGLERRELKAGTQYVVKYTDSHFVLQGPSYIHVICFEYNARPNADTIEALKTTYGCQDIKIIVNRYSEFSVEKVGVLKQVLKDGGYANIYTTDLAYERASYENWQKSRKQDEITLTMLYVPWLDVNQKVRYASLTGGDEADYLVKTISTSLDNCTMQITMTRFYPYYPWLRPTNTWGMLNNGTNYWGDIDELYWDEILYPVNTGA